MLLRERFRLFWCLLWHGSRNWTHTDTDGVQYLMCDKCRTFFFLPEGGERKQRSILQIDDYLGRVPR
jgi:hypothetical protein